MVDDLSKIPLKKNGEPYKILDKSLRTEMVGVKEKVMKHNWDYVSVVAGLPGAGKSTFARSAAKFCDHNFPGEPVKNEEGKIIDQIPHIVFTAQDFINITTTCPEYSSIVYDECFEGMNTKATLSPEFQKIINHLQLIRKRHLFIFLCLPNFFDLSKGIAVFRTSHLFLTYSNSQGKRGFVLAFSRGNKRRLYVEGRQYMNYNAVQANFRCKFTRNNWILDEELYETKKDKVLQQYAKKLEEKTAKKPNSTDKSIMRMFNAGKKRKDISIILDMPYSTVRNNIQKYRERGWLSFPSKKERDDDEEAQK